MNDENLSSLYLRRAILEAVVRKCQMDNDERWKERQNPEKPSVKEQLDAINHRISAVSGIKPVTVQAHLGTMVGKKGS